MSDTIKGFRGKDGPILLDYSGVANVPGAIKSIGELSARVGDHFEVAAVDSTGRVSTVKAVEKPGGGSGQNLELDSTLSQSGKAADAKATGDEIKRAEDLIPSIEGLAKEEDIPTKPEDIGARPNTWTPTAQEVGADPQGTAAGAVSAHNVSDHAHNDIRQELAAINARLTAFFDSDNQTLDELSEIVAYITSNKSLINAITTSKVSVEDIVNNLTTNVANKPLSAAQGVAIKVLIDGLSTGKLDASKLSEAINTALAQAKESGEFDGKDGDPGRGIKSIARTSGNGAAGTTDTYTITYTDDTTSTFQVRNGSNGTAGKAATLEITGVTALAPGATPTVTEVEGSTEQARKYALAIPQGAPGYTPVKFVDYWTDEDQEAIVQQVIDALGTPVFGRVEADNTIVLTGELVGNSYTFVYEDATGHRTTIGQYSQQTETVVDIQWVYGVKIDSSTGEETIAADYAKSQAFPVEDGTTYRIDALSKNRFGLGVCYYDASGNFLERVKLFDATYNGDKYDATIDIVGPFEFDPKTHNATGNAASFAFRAYSAVSDNSFYSRVHMTCVRG